MKFSSRWLPALACAMVLAASFALAAPPHIVLIVADDLGWMDLHCQGNERLNTPRIDALARQGARFTAAYAASPVCSPTRAALATGLSPARLHITQHGKDGPEFWPRDRRVQPPAAEHVLPLESVTIAERLRKAGYACGFFGKWHLSGERDPANKSPGGPGWWPEHQGFDVNVGGCHLGGPPTYFDPYRIPAIRPRKTGEYLDDRLADEAIVFLKANRRQPTFVCLWTYNVHFPFEAPDELVAKYKGKEGRGLKNAVYGAQVEALDRATGKVLDALDELGMAKETLVIFTSDNGGWEGATDNRPLRSGKGELYEGGLRVPLVVRWPQEIAGGRPTAPGDALDVPVISMDLVATIVDAAGVSLAEDETLDGESLIPLLRGKALQREQICFHYPHYAWHKSNRPGGAIRAGKYKAIRRYEDNSLELFDLAADEGETRNLAAELPEVAAKLDAALASWLKQSGAQMPEAVSR